MSQAGANSTSSGGNTGDLHVARYIVGNTSAGANYSTLNAGYAAAVAAGGSQTVFLQPGTYTENLTLVDGVSLASFQTSYFNNTDNANIVGKLTMTATGTASITGISLTTNADYVVEITGANTTTVVLNNCNINATNASAFHCTNATGAIQLASCQGFVSPTFTWFVFTGGTTNVDYCILTTSSTVASTFANATVNLMYTYINSPITTSGTGSIGSFMCQHICTNTTALTHGGSGSSLAMETRFESGTQSAISIGSSLQVIHCSIFSTNANAITGAGTLFYGMIVFYGSGASSGVNTNTVTALATLV